jgi:NAD(P)-dependent dehydrogenase (short-subunit alcohol dehydrogenase family)
MISPETESRLLPQIPLHRLGRPGEVAQVIYTLCGSAGSYLNGAEIHIDGGQRC